MDSEATGPQLADATANAVTSPARLGAADALRRLAHAFVTHQVDDAVLEEITALAEAFVVDIERAPARTHSFFAHGADALRERMKGGNGSEPDAVFPDCVVSGQASPVGMNAKLWREGDEAVLEVTLGPAFEGAPGRAHGGVVAALIDELMGLALTMADTLAFTGNLSVTYRAPTPIGVMVSGRAHLGDREGRKITIVAQLHHGDTLLAEAQGLFIGVEAAHFLGEH